MDVETVFPLCSRMCLCMCVCMCLSAVQKPERQPLSSRVHPASWGSPSFVLGSFLIKLIGDRRMNSITCLSLFHFSRSSVYLLRARQRAISGVEEVQHKDSLLIFTRSHEPPLQSCVSAGWVRVCGSGLIIGTPKLETPRLESFWRAVINTGEDLCISFAVFHVIFFLPPEIFFFLIATRRTWRNSILEKKACTAADSTSALLQLVSIFLSAPLFCEIEQC